MRTLALTLLAGWCTASPQDSQVVRLGTLAPDGSAWHKIIRDMAEEWKKSSGGKVACRIYAGGVLGDEPDMVRRMRVGQMDAAALTGVGLAEIAPEIFGIQLPMLLQSYEELDYVMERMAPRFEAILKEKKPGFTVLNWGDAGWVTFFGKQPIVSLDDLRKRKLFVWASNSVEAEIWKKAGVQVVPLPATDILPSLKSGLIDSFSTTPLAGLSFQWFAEAKNMTDMKWAPLIGATVMLTSKWQQIPEAQRPALVEAARTMGRRLREETRKIGEEAVTVMKKYDLKVHPVPPDKLAEWEKTARSFYPDIMGKKIPAELVAEIEKLRDEHRASKKQGK